MVIRRRTWALSAKDLLGLFGEGDAPRFLAFTPEVVSCMPEGLLSHEPGSEPRRVEATDVTAAVRAAWHAQDEHPHEVGYDDAWDVPVTVVDEESTGAILSAPTIYDDPKEGVMHVVGR